MFFFVPVCIYFFPVSTFSLDNLVAKLCIALPYAIRIVPKSLNSVALYFSTNQQIRYISLIQDNEINLNLYFEKGNRIIAVNTNYL